MSVEFWTTGVPAPGRAERQAEAAEEAGWTGMYIPDSQNLGCDPYVVLALGARATSRLKLATGVTNPHTRHPAVTATSILTVHAESGGRAVLGIGRGDSSLAHLGLGPAPVPVFAEYLDRLQAYLAGAEVPFGETSLPPMASGPTGSRLRWARRLDLPKVEVDVAATGPKVMAVAAARAERITFAVGADPQRVRWAIDTARAAAGDRPLSLGAWVNVVPHHDREVASRLAAGGLTSFARFSVMHGRPTGPVDDEERRVLEQIPRHYDMAHHFRAGAGHSAVVTKAFEDRFGIVGTPERCIERLQSLIDLGLARVAVIGGAPAGASDRDDAEESLRLTVAEVLPALQR